jgi:membrane protease YdiL (CAAX protease family)
MADQLLKSIIAFVGFLPLLWFNRKPEHHKLVLANGKLTNKFHRVIMFHFAGILWLAACHFPVTFTSQAFWPQSKLPEALKMDFFILVFLASVFVGLTSVRKMIGSPGENEISGNQITIPGIFFYLSIRIVFLYLYEYWLRGNLFGALLNARGCFVAIVTTTALYVLLHAFAGKKEIIACLPFGLLLCGLTILFRAIWPAVLLHIALSLAYEVKSITQYFKLLKRLS